MASISYLKDRFCLFVFLKCPNGFYKSISLSGVGARARDDVGGDSEEILP